MNPRKMHGIICDGDALKFYFRNTLNLVGRSRSMGNVARSTHDLKGVGKVTLLAFVLWVLIKESIPRSDEDVDGNKDSSTYKKNKCPTMDQTSIRCRDLWRSYSTSRASGARRTELKSRVARIQARICKYSQQRASNPSKK